MRTKHFAAGMALAMTLGATAAMSHASAADGIYIPLFTYRTGAFSGSGIPIANGIADYFAMLNERDGGIGGVKLMVEECETGYDTKKGIECYEAVKGKNPVVITPYSTGITLQLIPKASVDKIPVLSMAYGLSASADGNVFPWIFNPPATYWDGASMFVKYAAQVEGGVDKLKGKKIGLRPALTTMSRGAGSRTSARRYWGATCSGRCADPGRMTPGKDGGATHLRTYCRIFTSRSSWT